MEEIENIKNIKNMRMYKIFVLIVAIILLGVGVFIGFKSTKTNESKIPDKSIVVDNMIEEANVSIYKENGPKKRDIELIYKDVYTLCGETIEEKEIVYDTTYNDLKKIEEDRQKKDGKTYNVEKEEDGLLIYTRIIEQNCPNHFIVKLENGKILVYNIVSETISTVVNTIDIPQEHIRKEMLEELGIGIRADSKEALNLIMEDIES
ncbi:MAG: hypothetical protein RSE00_04045 [Clostridia bacterium]